MTSFAHQTSFAFTGNLDTIKFLGFVCLAIRVNGWISKRRKKQMAPWTVATADTALKVMEDGAKVIPGDWEEAWDALTWARSVFSKRDDLNPYEQTLASCIAVNKISTNEIGIVASLIPYYRNNRWISSSSQYIGEIKERITFPHLFVASAIPYDSGYGRTFSYILLDENKNVIAWRTAKKLKIGKVYHGRGTVKDHNMFCGAKRTVLTRCRLELVNDSLD